MEATKPARIPAASNFDTVNVIGVALFGAFSAWAYITADRLEGDAGHLIALVVAAGAIVILSSAVARVQPTLVSLLIVVSAMALLIVDARSIFSDSPLAGPFGYTNATASFFLQASLAALILVVMWQKLSLRIAASLAVAVLAIVPLFVDSRSAVLLLIAVPAVALGAWGRRGSRAAIAICALLLASGVGVTTFLGATYDSSESSTVHSLATATLSTRRVVLWRDATNIMTDQPVYGVGPSGFAETSRTAIGDADARWAHNEFLQVGAEMGIPGLLLMLALFGWAFWRLWSFPKPGLAAAVGAAGLAVLGLHACIDYIFHFSAVPVAGAALFGSALGATYEGGDLG
jgi:O-antigen ligase